MERLANLLDRAEVVKVDYSISSDISEEEIFDSSSEEQYDSQEENYVDNPLSSVVGQDISSIDNTYKYQYKPCGLSYVLVECSYENRNVVEVDTRVFVDQIELRNYCLAMLEYYNTFAEISYGEEDTIEDLIHKLIVFAYAKDVSEYNHGNVKIITCIIKGDNVTIYQKRPEFV